MILSRRAHRPPEVGAPWVTPMASMVSAQVSPRGQRPFLADLSGPVSEDRQDGAQPEVCSVCPGGLPDSPPPLTPFRDCEPGREESPRREQRRQQRGP